MELYKARPAKNEGAITVSEKYSESLDLVLTLWNWKMHPVSFMAWKVLLLICKNLNCWLKRFCLLVFCLLRGRIHSLSRPLFSVLDRGWDGWRGSLIQWTRIWASSGRWWRTGMPGVLLHGVAKSWTRLSDWTTTRIHFSYMCPENPLSILNFCLTLW